MQGGKRVKAQGMGLHTPEEIEEFGRNDLKVLSEMLADKPFFFGDEPTTVSRVPCRVLGWDSEPSRSFFCVFSSWTWWPSECCPRSTTSRPT